MKNNLGLLQKSTLILNIARKHFDSLKENRQYPKLVDFMRRLFVIFFIPVFAAATSHGGDYEDFRPKQNREQSRGSGLVYEVRFIGLEDRETLQAILESSQLVSLQHRPPASINGLRYRANADIPILIKVLHAYAYYDASISSSIVNTGDTVRVDLLIHPGPQFTLKSYDVYAGDCTQLAEITGCSHFTPSRLGLKLGNPALSVDIVNGELNVLNELSKCGYPLASIHKRRVEVDMAGRTVRADSCVNVGPYTKFGPTTFLGIKEIDPTFLQKKIIWKEGDIFNSDLLLKTQERLLKTELFSSVMITHGDTVDETGELPLKMRISEAKHKKIALGAFYATVNGFGGNITWTHRNVGGMGEILSLKAEYAQKSYTGIITYKKPDFWVFNQTYRALFEINHENIYAYHTDRYRLANYIERSTGSYGFLSVGLKADYTDVMMSATNGNYFLLGAPFFWKYERVEEPLDPKSGYSVSYSLTPYQSIKESNVHFIKQRFTGTCYFPLSSSKSTILAFRLQMGSIAGTERENVPLPKLFLGGSEDEMRGYKYQTLSPLEGKKPLGGRSAIYTSTELRFRIWDIGIVPFLDCGTVTNRPVPTFDTKWFKSMGLGLRYFAFFGPLRFDIGFPLDRRKHIDSRYQIYTSVGQAY